MEGLTSSAGLGRVEDWAEALRLGRCFVCNMGWSANMLDVRDQPEADDATESRTDDCENPLFRDERKLGAAEEKLEMERCCDCV